MNFRKNSELISDLLITALEGGSKYWYLIDANDRTQRKGKSMAENVVIDVMTGIREFDIFDTNEADEHLGKLSKEAVKRGLKLFNSDDYIQERADAESGNWDAETADVFLQLVVVGEVIFG